MKLLLSVLPGVLRRLVLAVLPLFLLTSAACGESETPESATPPTQTPQPDNSQNDGTMNTPITLEINGRTFRATLRDNAAARAFVGLLPRTLDMTELNGNEKYHYLPTSLPTAASGVETIHAGDLMLYGNNCIVLFYKTFSSGYSYTPLGALESTEGLAEAVGSGSVQVAFAIAE